MPRLSSVVIHYLTQKVGPKRCYYVARRRRETATVDRYGRGFLLPVMVLPASIVTY